MNFYPHIATMEADPTKAYKQDNAIGFIHLNGLRLKAAAKVQRKKRQFTGSAWSGMFRS